MDNKLALTTSITLAYREGLSEQEDNISTELIKELLDLVKVSEVNMGNGGESEATMSVKQTALDMIKAGDHKYDKQDLLARLRINIGDDEKWFNGIERSLNATLDEKKMAKSINSLRAKSQAMINQEKIGLILRGASGDWNFKYESIPDPVQFIQEFLGKLEPLSTGGDIKDNAVTEEMDFSKAETVEAVVQKVHEINSGARIWLTGHQGINDMTQGGFRGGETWAIGALPHNDKTGTSLTLFRQFATYNVPFVRYANKRPTIVRLSFEDPLTNNVQYLYKDIMVNQSEEEIDIKKVPKEEMSRVVRETMISRGFDVRMAYVDPSDWSFRSLFNYINKLEAEGHDVQVLMVDYLSMIPTTGCRQGPAGSDLQDLFRRVRNYCRRKDILFITPHQLSTEARNLTRGQVTDEGFLPFITTKGYWQDCKGLDREFDGALYCHVIRKDDDAWKAFCRDKHRIPTILPESKKFFMMKYPVNMPIPDDYGTESRVLKKIIRAASNAPADFLDF